MEDFPVASRIKNIISALGLTDSQFADRCGISRPTLSLLLAGKNKKISDVMISQIHEAFPKVSILWLLFGEGEMFKIDNPATESPKNDEENPIFPDNGSENGQQLNLSLVKYLENAIQNIVNKSVEDSKNELEKIVLKISQPENLRKASKITVYYDDSTFETFIPER